MLDDITKKDTENPSEWFINYCRKVKTNTVEIHKILCSDYYLKWLVNFSQTRTSLTDEYISPSGGFTTEDLAFISRLRYLYDAIRMYADKSYIVPEKLGDSYVYYLEFQGVIFRIGKMIDGSKSCSYTRVDTVPEETPLIKFSDMQDDKNLLQNDSLKSSLAELAKYVEILLNYGVPEEDILRTTEETIKLKLKKED